MSLSDNQSWQEPASFQLGGPASLKRLDFLLFKDEDSVTPYREEHLWVNVIERESSEQDNSSQIDTSEKINASATKLPITMEQKGKFVVLGMGEDDSDGDSHLPQMEAIRPDRSRIQGRFEPPDRG